MKHAGKAHYFVQVAGEKLQPITAQELRQAMITLCTNVKANPAMKIPGAVKSLRVLLMKHLSTFQVLLGTGTGNSQSYRVNVVAEPFNSKGSVTAVLKSIGEKLSAKVFEVGSLGRVDLIIDKVLPSLTQP